MFNTTVKTIETKEGQEVNPYYTPFTEAMGVLIRNLVGKSITAKIEIEFGQ
jgi:hypothetical protein